MDYKDFLNDIKNEIQNRIGENCRVELVQRDKNNGIKSDVLVVINGSRNTSPAVYPNIYYKQYKQGRTREDILDEICQIYQKYSDKLNISNTDLYNYEKIRKKVAYKLINFEKNHELLKEIPYVRFLDLAVVFFVVVSCSEDYMKENAVFLIRDEHLQIWGSDIGEVYRDALYNTPDLFPCRICHMTEILMELIGKKDLEGNTSDDMECDEMQKNLDEFKEKNHIKTYVLTNNCNANGAACILYKHVLKEFSERENRNFYIIPSSIHEVLLIPADSDIKLCELKEMVKEVNETELDEEEILSDNIYYYDYDKDNIKIL